MLERSQSTSHQSTSKRSKRTIHQSTSKRVRSGPAWKDAINKEMPGARYFLSTIPSKFDRLEYLKSRNATSNQKEALEFEWASWLDYFRTSGSQTLRDISVRLRSSTKRQVLSQFWEDLAHQETLQRQHQYLLEQRKLDIRRENVDQFQADGAAMTREMRRDLDGM
jgi:hypothetical protein